MLTYLKPKSYQYLLSLDPFYVRLVLKCSIDLMILPQNEAFLIQMSSLLLPLLTSFYAL